MFCGESENFYQTAANAVITGLLWHCCPFSSGGVDRDKRQRVLFCGFAWRLGGVGCFPSADGSRKAHAQWHGGRLVPERLRQWYRQPLLWLGRKAFCFDGMLELVISAKSSAVLAPCNACLCFPVRLLVACGAGNGMSGQNGGNPLFSGSIPLLLVFWRWRLLRGMRVFCRLPLAFLSGIGAGLAERCILYLGRFFYFIYPDLKKPVGFAVWKGCLLITAVVTVIVLLSGELWRGMLCRKSFADIADVGACQLYGRFSDQTGFASALVLDGIGGAVSFGCGVFRLPSGDAAMQTGGKKAKALALGGACGFVRVVISARKPYGGTASAACRSAFG